MAGGICCAVDLGLARPRPKWVSGGTTGRGGGLADLNLQLYMFISKIFVNRVCSVSHDVVVRRSTVGPRAKNRVKQEVILRITLSPTSLNFLLSRDHVMMFLLVEIV